MGNQIEKGFLPPEESRGPETIPETIRKEESPTKRLGRHVEIMMAFEDFVINLTGGEGIWNEEKYQCFLRSHFSDDTFLQGLNYFELLSRRNALIMSARERITDEEQEDEGEMEEFDRKIDEINEGISLIEKHPDFFDIELCAVLMEAGEKIRQRNEMIRESFPSLEESLIAEKAEKWLDFLEVSYRRILRIEVNALAVNLFVEGPIAKGGEPVAGLHLFPFFNIIQAGEDEERTARHEEAHSLREILVEGNEESLVRTLSELMENSKDSYWRFAFKLKNLGKSPPYYVISPESILRRSRNEHLASLREVCYAGWQQPPYSKDVGKIFWVVNFPSMLHDIVKAEEILSKWIGEIPSEWESEEEGRMVKEAVGNSLLAIRNVKVRVISLLNDTFLFVETAAKLDPQQGRRRAFWIVYLLPFEKLPFENLASVGGEYLKERYGRRKYKEAEKIAELERRIRTGGRLDEKDLNFLLEKIQRIDPEVKRYLAEELLIKGTSPTRFFDIRLPLLNLGKRKKMTLREIMDGQFTQLVQELAEVLQPETKDEILGGWEEKKKEWKTLFAQESLLTAIVSHSRT